MSSTPPTTSPSPTPPKPVGRVRHSWPLFVVFTLFAGVVAAVVSAGFLAESLAALGIPDPGALTTVGLPLVRGAAIMTASLSMGSFLFSSFLTSPRSDDLLRARLDVDGTIACRTGGWSALVTSMLALLLVPMYLSDVSGEPLVEAVKPANWSVALGQVSTSIAFVWVAIIGLVAAVGGLVSSRWIMQPVWLLFGFGMFVPLGLEGHSATGGDHDYGTNSYLWHLLFVGLWVGGLMALIAHGRRKGPGMELAVRRYSTIALISVVGMAISGLINAAIRLHFSDWFTTSYGWLIVGKTVGVVLLALVGLWHRKLTIPKLAEKPQLFRRVAAGEVLLMGAVIGLAIALGRTPPPPPRVADINTMDIQLGYKLFVAPTWTNVWTMWRFDIVFGTLAIVLSVGYLWGVWKLKQQGQTWPWWRTAWFIGGNIMLLVTMCSGIGMYMPALFSMHMVGHMILSMGVPVFWVLGGPATLALKTLAPGAPGQPGMREWVAVLIDNPLVRVLTHPAVNTIQFLVFFYALYLNSIYSVAVSEHAGHLGMNIMFLLSGTIYFWELIGVDPIPREEDPKMKLWWLTFSLPVHMFFGVTLMMLQTVLAGDFYASLGLPWNPDLLHDQLVGGGVAWASGQFPLLIVYIVIVRQWFKDDQRVAKAYDEHADLTDDEEMAAYNEMLAQLNQTGRDPRA